MYLPAGTYLCRTPVELPDGVAVRGDGDASWIKGQVVFASDDHLDRLKIGDSGRCAIANAPNASGTSFVACRFHGGGSRGGADNSVVYLGGTQGSVSDVLFADCEIERTSYAPPPGVDAYANGVGNTISILEYSYLPHGAHVAHITFRHCHLGASNGHATGALRMMLEAFCWDNRTGRSYHGWQDLALIDCTIEASDNAGLDFADQTLSADHSRHSASGVLVQGCTFLGAHKDRGSQYTGLPIVYECPGGIVIRNNTFYASPREAIGGSHVGDGATASPGLVIEGNMFDMTSSPIGLTHDAGEPCISLVGFKSRVVGNTFVYDKGLGMLFKGDVSSCSGNTVQGNTFTDRRSSGGEPTIEFVDQMGKGCLDNHVDGNTITNRAAGTGGVITQTGGGPNFAHGNTIFCGGSVPFVALSGRLVHAGNRVIAQ